MSLEKNVQSNKNLFGADNLALRQEKLRPLKEKLRAVALASPEFKEELKYAAAEIAQGAIAAENEATIEGIFERVIYAVMREIGIQFHPHKEVIIDTRRHTSKGRADSRIGAVVIEYKHRTKLKTDQGVESALKQLLEYITPLSQESHRETIGFLTDGIQFYETRAYDGTIISVSGKADVNEKTLLSFIRCVVY